MGIAYPASAQAPGQTEPANAPFLEKRVPEELATEGVVLSRRNLGLQIEQLGDKWLVSVVDLTTGRVAASTKVDVLPADREAAVATMTHVVAELAAQVVGHGEPPAPATPPAATPPPVVIDDRAERTQREIADLKFQRQAIRFSSTYLVTGGGLVPVSGERNWKTFQGELGQELKPLKFYEAVGRPDLAASYRRRRGAMIGGYVAAGIGYIIAGAFTYAIVTNPKDCSIDLPDDEFQRCLDDDSALNRRLWGMGIGLGISVVGLSVAIYYAVNRQPIDKNDAAELADRYNQALRGRLGLPVVMHRPLLRDLRLAPYVNGNQGGLALSARF